jgi:hypothetical protein
VRWGKVGCVLVLCIKVRSTLVGSV